MKVRELRVDVPAGMDTAYRPSPNGADLIEDMWWDAQGCWRQVGGYERIANTGGFLGAGSVESMFWFTQHNGARRYLVFERRALGGDLELFYFDAAKQAAQPIDPTPRTYIPGPWQRTQYCAVGNWLWYLNGHEEPRRWGGTNRPVVRIGFSLPPPPPLLSDSNGLFDRFGRVGAAVITSYNDREQRGVGDRPTATPPDIVTTIWRYGYAITWVNDLGQESPPSPIAYASGQNIQDHLNPAFGINGRKTVMVTFPDGPAHVYGARLYRTRNLVTDNEFESDGARQVSLSVQEQVSIGQLYFHSEWATGRGFTLGDDKPDFELGAQLDPDRTGPLPRGVKYLAPYQGCMFLAGSPEYPDRVWFSAPGLPEQFPAINYIDVGNRDSGEVTGLYPTQNALVVFKRRGTLIIEGDPSRGFTAKTLSPDVGCSSPNAMAEAPGLGLVFVSESGVFLIEGVSRERETRPARITRISTSIQRVWDARVNTRALMSAQGVLFRRQREIWLQVPADGAGSNGDFLGLVYHYETGAWSIRPAWPINCFTESKDERGYLFFGARNDRGVYAYSRGRDKGGVSVVAKYRTTWHDLGSVWGRSQVLYASPYLLNYGDRVHAVTYRRDRLQDFEPAQGARKSEDSEFERAKWGTATWGSKTIDGSVWTDVEPTVVRHDVTNAEGHLGMNALEWQMEIQSTRIGLASYALGVPQSGHDETKQSDVLQAAKR